MNITTSLLKWYDQNRRQLPWRASKGQRPDPYHVWLSEIMLQQTTVPTVLGYFPRFIKRWPSIKDLASASLDDILFEWQGLGYYSRARNLLLCAKEIVAEHNGSFPKNDLISLPGIGPYTAAAIGAIAFGQRVAAIDANAERVISRLFRLSEKSKLAETALPLVPAKRPGDFAQALMDLGSMICQSKNAKCDQCPLSPNCEGYQRGDALKFPLKKERKERRQLFSTAYWIEDPNGQIAFQRRPDKGLLGGLMEIPMSDWVEKALSPKEALAKAPMKGKSRPLPVRIEHIFTHIHLEVTLIETKVAKRIKEYEWHDPPFRHIALSSLMRKIIKAKSR